MRITNLKIKNFRGIKSADLFFTSHTVLIGDNNIGKSTILESLDLVLGPDRLSKNPVVDEHDFYDGLYQKNENGFPQIEIEVMITSLNAEQLTRFRSFVEWWDQKKQLLNDDVGEVDKDNVEPALRVTFIGNYNEEEDDFEGATFYTRSLSESENRQPFSKKDKQFCGFLYLRSIRTGSRALSLEKGSLLDIILRIKDLRPNMWENIIGPLSKFEVASDGELGIVGILENIEASIRKYVPREWGVSPHLKISSQTRKHLREIITAFIATGEGTHAAPFYRQGAGTINLLVLAMLSMIAEEKQNVIFAMEEVETAIPPYTQKRVVHEIRKLSAQSFFTSHSPYVLEEFEIADTCILVRSSDGNMQRLKVELPEGIKDKRYNPKPYFSLWADIELGLHIPDADFNAMLDSCSDPHPSFDCDTLQLFINYYNLWHPGQNLFSWLNQTLGFNYNYAEYIQWFDSCGPPPPPCDYFDSLYSYYSSHGISTPVAQWLNIQSGLNYSFWDYVHMLDGCVCFVFPCDTLDSIVQHIQALPQPWPLFYLYANNNFGLTYSESCYNAMLDSCAISPPLTNCDSLHDLYNIYLDSIPLPDLTAWFNDRLGFAFTYWDYIHWFDSCHISLPPPCDTITLLYHFYKEKSITTPFADWMNIHLDLHFTLGYYQHLLDSCGPVITPCDSIDMAVKAYLAQPDTSLDFTTFLNDYLGWSLTLAEFRSMLDSCHQDTTYWICDHGWVQPTPDSVLTENCLDDFIDFAYSNAQHNYQLYLDSISGTFVDQYVSHCLNSFNEDFYMDGPFSEYHYTLYYYDQAGNLAQTIPPNGVTPFSHPDTLQDIQEFRSYIGSSPHYQHSAYASQYTYNTLNKPVGQHTPDADSSHYWYDNVGRLVFSQNAEQYIAHTASYTRYDDLGRIIEVGKLETLPFDTMEDSWARDTSFVEPWIEFSPRSEVTHTYYDVAAFNPNPDFVQENLRNRVASVTYEDVYDGDSLTYQSATHYTYDISGNVKTILQENTILRIIYQSLKRIDYDYDLVSGKVNYVYYEKDSTDQFIHHYEYDDDNRITHVSTSRDGILWDEDAHYEYYLHGPLARIELGQNKVQGVDYAYTLQGWMKGINASTVNPERDMGRDGIDLANGFSRDAYGFSLGYFFNDYKQIDPDTNFEADYTNAGTGSTFGTSSFGASANLGLYNGNIRHSVLSMDSMNYPNMGYVYQYDQLNRLKEMTAYAGLDTVANANKWNTDPALDDYKEMIDFDPNGNILKYIRRGTTTGTNPIDMDSMNYQYYSDKNQLEYVDDGISGGNYSNDIDDQSSANYTYDANGNLIQDNAEGLTLTWWNNGKLKHIDKAASGDQMDFNYDPSGNRISKSYYDNTTMLSTTTYYVRDAQGNIMATYERRHDSLKVKEFDIYGSSRVGVLTEDSLLTCYSCIPSTGYSTSLFTGRRQYELTNHLGNVLATISDKKIYYDADGDNIPDYSIPEISSEQDYYPFGMQMPGRSLSLSNYRFGFNGMEKDDETIGEGNQINYVKRGYDPRIARFLSIDPITKKYPELSPFQFASNSPIAGIDLDGLEILPVGSSMYREKYLGGTTTLALGNDVEVINKNIPKDYKFGNQAEFYVGPYGKDVPISNGIIYQTGKSPNSAWDDTKPNSEDESQEATYTTIKTNPKYKFPYVGTSPNRGAENVGGAFGGLQMAEDVANFAHDYPEQIANGDEAALRHAFYRATKIVDFYINKKLMNNVSETFRTGMGRADLINYITDGTLPQLASKGGKKAIDESRKYIANIITYGNEIMRREKIPIRNNK